MAEEAWFADLPLGAHFQLTQNYIWIKTSESTAKLAMNISVSINISASTRVVWDPFLTSVEGLRHS